MRVFRSPDNPIIEPRHIKPSRDDLEVVGVFNAAATRVEGEVILLLRVAERPVDTPGMDMGGTIRTAIYDVSKRELVIKEFSKDNLDIDFSDPRLIITPDQTYLTSLSHLRLARSTDGISFEIEDAPAVFPANNYETFGVEDPRISLIDGTYYISYVAVCPFGVTTCLASTQDFVSFRRHGVIFCPENKDVVLFPEKIGGKFYALHRPVSPLFRKHEVWIAESPDLSCWGNHRYLMGPRSDSWDKVKIGAGAVPFRTDQGWLEVYHGVDRDNRYCLGGALLAVEEPWKVTARTEMPILEPQADYECRGFFEKVVFSCGVLHEGDKLRVYYGAADTAICYAELSLGEVIEGLGL